MYHIGCIHNGHKLFQNIHCNLLQTLLGHEQTCAAQMARMTNFLELPGFPKNYLYLKSFSKNLIKNPKSQKIEVMDFGIANVAYHQNHRKSFGILEQYFLKPIW